jgi:hypothetical protein
VTAPSRTAAHTGKQFAPSCLSFYFLCNRVYYPAFNLLVEILLIDLMLLLLLPAAAARPSPPLPNL